MNDEAKRKQLRKYKAFATGLFVLMAVIFIVTTILQKSNILIGSVMYVLLPKQQWWVLWQTGLQ
jgi:uncharacterized membrane-anchored protein YjiN (DUF445 family)